MKIKKISCLVLATSMLMGLMGCSKTAAPSSTDVKKPIEIVFWHAMAGVNGQGIATLVDKFNNSQN
jgi:ABC-type glycerol-3-phosphate transport system substrate-binding protein